MSIQRWMAYVNNRNVAQMYAEPEGLYVTYADHLAEIERVGAQVLVAFAEAKALLASRDEAWEEGVQAERQRCIAAVTSCYLTMDTGEILNNGGTWENALNRALAAIEGSEPVHQPRERSVPCSRCQRQQTWNISGICSACGGD